MEFSTRKACDLGITVMRDLSTVGGKKWDISQIQEFLKKYSNNKDAGILWKNFSTYKESAFENFNVTTYFVVQNNIETAGPRSFKGVDKKNPKNLIQKGYIDNKIPGDGTVPFASQLGPALKWAEEFDQNPNKTKPIKIVHYCNDYFKRASNTYKTKEEWTNRLKDQKKNEYLGLNCKCGNTDFAKQEGKGKVNFESACNHSMGFNDPNMYGFVNMIIVDNHHKKIKKPNMSSFFNKLNGNYLTDMSKNCMLDKPYFLKNYASNFNTKNRSFLRKKFDDKLRRRLLERK